MGALGSRPLSSLPRPARLIRLAAAPQPLRSYRAGALVSPVVLHERVLPWFTPLSAQRGRVTRYAQRLQPRCGSDRPNAPIRRYRQTHTRRPRRHVQILRGRRRRQRANWKSSSGAADCPRTGTALATEGLRASNRPALAPPNSSPKVLRRSIDVIESSFIAPAYINHESRVCRHTFNQISCVSLVGPTANSTVLSAMQKLCWPGSAREIECSPGSRS